MLPMPLAGDGRLISPAGAASLSKAARVADAVMRPEVSGNEMTLSLLGGIISKVVVAASVSLARFESDT